MKKIISAIFVAYCLSLPSLALAYTTPVYTINDSNNDAFSPSEESYKISVKNFVPGVDYGRIYFNLYTNLAPTRASEVADLFITESYRGNDYLWAMPFVDHDGFTAASLYAVGAYKSANDLGANLDTDVPVRITSLGSNYGHTGAQGGSVCWDPGWLFPESGDADWLINTSILMYEDDPNGNFHLTWGTTIYGADIVSGSLIPETTPVPVPASVLLFGTGAISLLAGKRRRK
jgi:hypothetical protein